MQAWSRVPRCVALLTTFAVLLGCGAACAVGPSDRPAVAVRDAPLPPAPAPTTTASAVPLPQLEPSGHGSIDFPIDCTSQTRRRLGVAATRNELRYQCGSVTVELNPDEPRRRAGVAGIHVLRTGTGRIPLVVVGDVAGEPGSLLAARLANQMPPELLASFSLIGVDRRGTGSSEAVRCVPGKVRERLIAIDPGATRLDGAQAILDAANEATRICVQQIEDTLSLIDSWRAAGDLEQIRMGLGARRLNAIAVGDGSRVLSAYISRFASTVGRIVLDGAPDPTQDAIGAGLDLAVAAEHAFDAFANGCAATACALAPDPRQALITAADRLRRDGPRTAGDGTTVSAGTLFTAVLAGLADTAQWPALAAAVASAGRGEVDGVARLVQPLLLDGSTNDPARVNTDPARLDAALLTTCNDTTTRVPPDRVGQLADDWKTRAPLFGALFAQRLLICSPAPVPSKTVPPPRAAGTPPVLVLGTDGDPLTPLSATRRMAETLAAGLLVTWQGNGHGAFPRTPCVTSAVQSFLTDGTLPPTGTICPP